MNYEVSLQDAIVGNWYQLNPKLLFPVKNDYIDIDRSRNLESLVREPHKLTRKDVGRNGVYLYYLFDFELTQTDRDLDADEIANDTMWFRRKWIQLNSYYRYDINTLVVEDVVLKAKYEQEEKETRVKQFLEKAIGPCKEALYAPPGVYGEKGGLLYRASLKAYSQTKKVAAQ